MNLSLPDKYVRKAVSTLINNIVVDTQTIPCYDYRASNSVPDVYTVMSTQTNQVNRGVKCGYQYESSILIEIFTRYIGSGNTGSRLLADNICDAVRNLVKDKLVLEGGLNVVDQVLDFPSDLVTITENENVFRKFIRIELTIN